MNNFEYWYDHGNVFRQTPYDILNININPVSRTPDKLLNECIISAEEIYKETPDIHVALSGGWESQICLNSFIRAGYKPGVLIIRFPKSLNDFDVLAAESFCKKYQIVPTIIDVNFPEFVEKFMLDTATKYQTYTLFQTLLAYISDTYDHPLLIADKLNIRRDVHPSGKWCIILDEDQDMWSTRFNSINNKKNLVNNFYKRHPELVSSFIQTSPIPDILSGVINGKLSINSSKHLIYRQGGFENIKASITNSVANIQGISDSNISLIRHALKYSPRKIYIPIDQAAMALSDKGNIWKYI